MFYLRISDDDCILIGNRDLHISSWKDGNKHDGYVMKGCLSTMSNDYFYGEDSGGGDKADIFEGDYDKCVKLLDWILSEGEAKSKDNPNLFVLDVRDFIKSLAE